MPEAGSGMNQFVCRRCGVAFESRHFDRAFCSDECRSAAVITSGSGMSRGPCPACTEVHLYPGAEAACIRKAGEARKQSAASVDRTLAESRDLDAAVYDAFHGHRSSGGTKPAKAPKRAA